MFVVDEKQCIGCESCVENCPMECISIDINHKAKIDNDACTGCEACISVCPVGAIY